MTFEHKLEQIKTQVAEYLGRVADRQEPISLYEPIRYTLDGGGKRLRPVLLILSAEALGASVDSALPAAAAVELLHNFTLVHDDIMDHDDTRRGRPTVHTRWDIDVALLAGDGLVALAYHSLLQTPTPRLVEVARLFTEGLIDLCEGQALDREFESRQEVSLDEYLTMISKKTASLLSMCAQIGGHIGEATVAQIQALKTYGESLGIAFQIQDDLLDVTADPQVLGKDFCSDIRQKKKTFLWVHAVQHAIPELRRQLQQHFALPELNGEHIGRIRSIFYETGAVDHAQRIIQTYIARAQEGLRPLEQTGVPTDHLKELLALVLRRQA